VGGVLLEGTVGAAESGDAPVLVKRRRDAGDHERGGDEQQQRGPTEGEHGPAMVEEPGLLVKGIW
jgi:hypothetical protein